LSYKKWQVDCNPSAIGKIFAIMKYYRLSFPVFTNRIHCPWFLKSKSSHLLFLQSSFVVGLFTSNTQNVAPGPVVVNPASQAVHAEAPVTSKNVPMGQSAASAAPVTPIKLPSGASIQDTCPVSG